MPFLSPNQQCQSTEGKLDNIIQLYVTEKDTNEKYVPELKHYFSLSGSAESACHQ